MAAGSRSVGRHGLQLTSPLRILAPIALAAILAGCLPDDEAVVWEQHVPSPAPEAIENQPVVARGPNSITLMPISPRGAVVGVPYGYDMPHCGIASPIDVDGSFWDAAIPPADRTEFDMQTGTFTLLSTTEATFTAADGRVLRLVRHAGPKAFGFCD